MPFRDPEPFTVAQIEDAFNRAIAEVDKATYNARGFDIIGNLMRDVLRVPITVEAWQPTVQGLRIRTRVGEVHEQSFFRYWNRGGFEERAA